MLADEHIRYSQHIIANNPLDVQIMQGDGKGASMLGADDEAVRIGEVTAMKAQLTAQNAVLAALEQKLSESEADRYFLLEKADPDAILNYHRAVDHPESWDATPTSSSYHDDLDSSPTAVAAVVRMQLRQLQDERRDALHALQASSLPYHPPAATYLSLPG